MHEKLFLHFNFQCPTLCFH